MLNSPKVLKITKKASKVIHDVMLTQEVPGNYFLRVGMRGGGCGGMGYVLGFDKVRDNDIRYEIDGLAVVIDRAHSMYVLGMEIDWHEDEHQKGFVFNNPHIMQDHK